MSTITLTTREWYLIKNRIATDHGKSMIMLSARLKREMGFIVREHTAYDTEGYTRDIRLDFYDEHSETMFRLKYL